jgi:hypothetical protein
MPEMNAMFGVLGNPRNRGLDRARDWLAEARTRQPAASPTPSSSGQNSALNAFMDTPLYTVPFERGVDAINANYAGRGALQSGAAMKAISDYAGDSASGALRDYFSLLGNQQAIGFNAAAGQAGAAGNYANSITGSNTNYANALSGMNNQYAAGVGGALGNLGNAYGQGAINTGNILANQQIANANNTNSMIGGIGSSLGNAAGYFAYQPYGGRVSNGAANYPIAQSYRNA